MLSKHLSKRIREGYCNYRLGPFRLVLAHKNRTYNLTLYYHSDNDYQFDVLVWPWKVDLSYNKF